MFKNMGGKIKGLTKFICWIGIIISIAAGAVLVVNGVNSQNDPALIAGGIAAAIGGSLFSWISSFVAYGFGELVESSSIQAALMIREEMEGRAAGNVPQDNGPRNNDPQNNANENSSEDLSKLAESLKF